MNAPQTVATAHKFSEGATRLYERIMDDSTYTRKRLGRMPSEQEVSEAAARLADQADNAMAIALDPIEADLWSALGEDDTPEAVQS